MEELNSKLRNANAEIEKLNSNLQVEAQRAVEREQVLLARIASFQDDEKQREVELQQLRAEVKRLKLQNLDESKYAEWGPDEIAAWIVNLDVERMKKYEEAVNRNLKEDEVDGSLLSQVDGGDLRTWGIGKFADRKFVQQEIARLVANYPQKKFNDQMADMNLIADEGAHAAPTAYV